MGVQFQELMNWVRRRKVLASLLATVTLGVGIIIGTIVSGRVMAVHDEAPSGAALLAVPDPISLSNGFSAITKKLEPAVVNISTEQVIERPKHDRDAHRGDEDPFGDFFDRFFDEPDQAPDAERSLGSGLIVDKNGFILTNNHVIEEATRIRVALSGQSARYTARVIGTDKDTDLAVIKIDAGHDLPVAAFGNSDGVQVGDWVLAFGSPFGLDSTVTAGIVSAKERSIAGDARHEFQRFIQTDAAINPGNSGGPLVNLDGQVIGINTAIYTGSHGFEGVGFAMPSNTAISVYNDLVSHGKVVRGAIGVRFAPQDNDNPVLMRELGAPYGVQVEDVRPGSPAEKAGIQPGDVITRVDSRPVHKTADLIDPIARTPIGHRVTLDYVRNGKTRRTTAVVEDRSHVAPEVADDSESEPDQERPAQFGLHVEDLTPDLAKKLGMSKVSTSSKSAGVVVSEVDPASFAEDVQFDRGDVIAEVNRVSVSSVSDYRREMGKLRPGNDVLFKVFRRSPDDDGRLLTVYLAGTIPAPGK